MHGSARSIEWQHAGASAALMADDTRAYPADPEDDAAVMLAAAANAVSWPASGH